MKNQIMLKELSDQELSEIEGGRTLWEYIAYGIGYYMGSTANNVETLEAATMSV